jgi:hypothetical protein
MYGIMLVIAAIIENVWHNASDCCFLDSVSKIS